MSAIFPREIGTEGDAGVAVGESVDTGRSGIRDVVFAAVRLRDEHTTPKVAFIYEGRKFRCVVDGTQCAEFAQVDRKIFDLFHQLRK